MVPTKERRSWSNLPPELLEFILQKLVLKDYLKCRRVCRSWRSAINDALATKRCPPAPQFPYLLIIPHSLPKKEPATLLDITQNTSQSIPTHDWEGKYHLVLSQEGWLMFQDPYFYYKSEKESASLFWIFNPVSGEKYELPPLSWQPHKCPRLSAAPYKIAAFSPAPNPQNFLVAVYLWNYRWISETSTSAQLYFCRVTDKSWTLVETYEHESESTSFTEMVLLDWKLYAMSKYKIDFVTVFDLRDPNALTVERLDIQFPSLEIRNEVICEIKMIKDSTCEQVLLVNFSIKHREIKDICVFKLDMSSPRWIKVDSLNDRALLMDSKGVRVISTAKLSGPPEYIRGNCVFFTFATWLSQFVNSNFGVFFLKDNTIKPFPSSPLRISSPSHNLWFTPCPW